MQLLITSDIADTSYITTLRASRVGRNLDLPETGVNYRIASFCTDEY